MRSGMAQEEHTQRSSKTSSGDGGGGGGDGCGGGSSSSSRSLKNSKQKKVPQRGLGVAQLEKIRLEEQQNKDIVVLSPPNSLVSPSNSSPNLRRNPSPSLIPSPLPLPTDLSSPNSMFRMDSSIPSIDFLHPNSIPLSKPSSGNEGEIGWPSISGLGQGHSPKLWKGDCNLGGENHRLDHHGFAFRSNVNLPFDSKPIWPPPNVMQRAHEFQQQPCTTLSMVNVPSGTSSSSGINYHQMEPPSNQSFYGKTNTPMWSEEDKMVGRKRSYPFSLDNPPGLSFPCKFPPTFVPLTKRSDEPSSGNGGTVSVELSNPTFSTLLREGPSSSSLFSELNPKEVAKENGELRGDFLTLAPPTTAVPHPCSKFKHRSVYLNPHSRELPDFESLPFQGVEDLIHRPGPSGSTQQLPFYSFYPSARARISQATTAIGSCSGGVGEKLDLNLKL